MSSKRTLIKAGLSIALATASTFGLAARADATESHVSAACNAQGAADVSVYATDHGKTAAVTDAYVLDAAGNFDGATSAVLRSVFAGVTLTTGPAEGAAGPSVTRSVTAPSGLRTFAITLTFSDGTTSTGRAAVTFPCTAATTTTTAAPITTTTSTSTTLAPTTTVVPPARSAGISCAAPGQLRVTNPAAVALTVEWWNGTMAPIAETAVGPNASVTVAYPNPVGLGFATGYVARWADGVTFPPHVDVPGGTLQAVQDVGDDLWACRNGTTVGTTTITSTSASTPATVGSEVGTPTSLVRLPATGASTTVALSIGALFLVVIGALILVLRARRPILDELDESEML